MSETQLIVLWEFARCEELRIVDDIRTRFSIVHDEILNWPDDPVACFGRFYGANLPDANGKVRHCGGGAFRMLIVTDPHPAYGLRETSRGLERVNLNLFDAKIRYREWTGGGHKVHTTNSVAEAERDIFLLTGHTASEWAQGRPDGDSVVLPGQAGWKSLREIFAFLDRLLPYAVLRNAETLPDAFDPTVHGDIDLLVENAEATASLLGARKVYPEPHRVHYEVTVAGQPVRFDFRFIGDDYYDAAWERRMLERRVSAKGVWLLHPEDAFFALVYHALFQKREIARDYVAKAAALAAAAGLAWTDYADALLQLEGFLAREDYGKPRPVDASVYWNTRLVSWRKLADELSALSGMTGVRPVHLEALYKKAPLAPLFFSGELDGQRVFVKYVTFARSLAAAEWRYPRELVRNGDGDLVAKPLLWHVTSDGGAFSVTEWLDGESLDALIARNDPRLVEKADVLAGDFLRMAAALERAKIVHRDIRPANLIVGADGHVKLIDFQFAAPPGDSREDPWFKANPFIIGYLGAEYAFAPGQWNDRHSLGKVLDTLPPSPARDSARHALANGADRPTKIALCSKRQMRRIRHRRACLRWKEFIALFSPRKRERFLHNHARELEFLNLAVATWHVR